MCNLRATPTLRVVRPNSAVSGMALRLVEAPHQNLRVGQFRLGCRADREQRILDVVAIRGGNTRTHPGQSLDRLYKGDD